MYDTSLSLERTNCMNNKAAFLDLDIRITHDNRIETSLYIKTDDYDFKVIRFPHYFSNIPRTIPLNTINGELVRIYRNCSEYTAFIAKTKNLIKICLDRKYPEHHIIGRIIKCITRNPNIQVKYHKTKEAICHALLGGT